MRESPEQLRRRIVRGEDGSLELKEVVFSGSKIAGPRRKELADELAAFANGAGGTVVLGVRDGTREVVGIDPERQAVLERCVAELVRDSIEPALYPEIDWYELPDAAGREVPVLRVNVERSLFVHRGPGGYVPQYDMTAVFEAVVNAVAHRDYAVRGSRIRLQMFSDRLELFSPGGLPNTLTVESLAYRQSSRNETIASLLARCPVPEDIPDLQTSRTALMDRRGEGVGTIFERSEELSGRQPVYELFDDAELRLTIFAAGPEEADG